MAENTDRKNRERVSFQAGATIVAEDQDGRCHDWMKLQIIPVRHFTDVDVLEKSAHE